MQAIFSIFFLIFQSFNASAYNDLFSCIPVTSIFTSSFSLYPKTGTSRIHPVRSTFFFHLYLKPAPAVYIPSEVLSSSTYISNQHQPYTSRPKYFLLPPISQTSTSRIHPVRSTFFFHLYLKPAPAGYIPSEVLSSSTYISNQHQPDTFLRQQHFVGV